MTEEPREDADTVRKPAGRVRRDPQGNVVWEWERDGAGTTSRLLRRLEVPGLRIVEEKSEPAAVEAGRDLARERAQGFDPYGGHAAVRAQPGAGKPRRPPAADVRKPSLLARLFGRPRAK